MNDNYAIQALNLTKYYGDLLAVDHISSLKRAANSYLKPNSTRFYEFGGA